MLRTPATSLLCSSRLTRAIRKACLLTKSMETFSKTTATIRRIVADLNGGDHESTVHDHHGETCKSSLHMAFSSLASFGRRFDNLFTACAFLKIEISSGTLIPLLRPGSEYSGSASWDDCARVFPRFPKCSHTMPGQRHNQPTRTSLGQGKDVCVFRCNPPPALLAGWPGSFTCHCGNTGVEWTPNKSQHTKLTLKKNIIPPLLPGFELTTFRVRIRRSTSKPSRLCPPTSKSTSLAMKSVKVVTPFFWLELMAR